MKYPIVIHQEGDSAYGVTVPDIAGCFSAGDTLDEAFDQVVNAIKGHLELLAEDGDLIPLATSLAQHQQNPDYIGGIWALVDIDITPYLGKSEKVNVTLPAYIIQRIDQAVQNGKGKNRSAFLAESALRYLSAV